MKKFGVVVVGAMLAIGVLVAFSGESNCAKGNFDVGTNSLMIAAPRSGAKDWTAGSSYAHGDRVRATNDHNRVYWNVNGTLTATPTVTMPSHAWGDATDNTTSVWRRVPPMNRSGMTVCNTGPSTAWIVLGEQAAFTNGITLASGANWSPVGEFNGSVYAITTGGSARITIQEY